MSEKEPLWVLDNVVMAIHRRQISEHGGVDGVRDASLLESALDKPRNLFFYGDPKPEIADIAAAYAYGIIRNHPFVDGNKRTALVTCLLFLQRNSLLLNASYEEKYNITIQLADGTIGEKEFAQWLAKRV